MKIKNFEIEFKPESISYILSCIKNMKFKKLKSAVCRFDSPDEGWDGYFIYVYPLAVYLHNKEK